MAALIFSSFSFAVCSLSNNPAATLNRFVWLGAYLVVCVVMFIGDDEDKTYLELAYLIRFYTSRKTYKKDAKRGTTDELIPFKAIRDDGLIEYDGYYGALIEVGSIDFGLLDEAEQDRKISAPGIIESDSASVNLII